jgi:hypothetical protein
VYRLSWEPHPFCDQETYDCNDTVRVTKISRAGQEGLEK